MFAAFLVYALVLGVLCFIFGFQCGEYHATFNRRIK